MTRALQPKVMPIGERKIMPMGHGGLVVTIPRVWARFLQLKAGDMLELEMDKKGELHIRPKRLPNPPGRYQQ